MARRRRRWESGSSRAMRVTDGAAVAPRKKTKDELHRVDVSSTSRASRETPYLAS